MDNKEILFFRNNLKRTILSQSRYLCPRKRVQPATKTLYTSQSVPLLPGSCRKILPNSSLPKSISSESDDFKSATSLTTEISRKTGLARKCLKVTIPTARPWSCYSDDSSFQSCYSSDSKSWNNLSPVYITKPRHSVTSSSHQDTSSEYPVTSSERRNTSSGQIVTSSERRNTSSGQIVTSSRLHVPSSNSSTWGSFAEETPDDFRVGRESEKGLSVGLGGGSVRSDDSNQLTNVISGVCLLDSLEQMSNRGHRGLQFGAPIKGVKSVLHRQIP